MKHLSIIFCLFILSCTKDESDKVTALGQIDNIVSLKTIQLGQSDTIVITFGGGTNGCAKPDHLVPIPSGNTITFKAYYNYPKKSQICTQNIPIHKLQYIFKPINRGTYSYKSYNTNASSTTKIN